MEKALRLVKLSLRVKELLRRHSQPIYLINHTNHIYNLSKSQRTCRLLWWDTGDSYFVSRTTVQGARFQDFEDQRSTSWLRYSLSHVRLYSRGSQGSLLLALLGRNQVKQYHAPFLLSQIVPGCFPQSRRAVANRQPSSGYSGNIQQRTWVQLQQYQFGYFERQASNEVNAALAGTHGAHQLSESLHDVAACSEDSWMMLLRRIVPLYTGVHRSGWLILII